MEIIKRIHEASDYIKSRIGGKTPFAGIILGRTKQSFLEGAF